MRLIALILALCAACGHDGFEPTDEEINADGQICDAPLFALPYQSCPGRLVCKPMAQSQTEFKTWAFKTCQFP